MDEKLRQLLKIPYDRLDDINAVLLNPDMQVVNDVLAVVEKYGTPEEINRKAEQARQLPNLLKRVEQTQPKFSEGPGMAAGTTRPEGIYQCSGISP